MKKNIGGIEVEVIEGMEKKVCSICGYPIDDPFGGCNPWPIADRETDGPCCHFCDNRVVMPARFKLSDETNKMKADGLDEAEIDYQIDSFIIPEIRYQVQQVIEEIQSAQKILRGEY